ncbi:hypothetical protein G5714_013841 [Onychostoma macrolepis]|uniref:Uncharacterized protein n=1 Tax=Onychostoma macrolepis TaxID=369639 RepID=A0A7J6CFU9_9TELE|nr:hypothetical protein G5714_013841 [Onychostoma macrolepis]
MSAAGHFWNACLPLLDSRRDRRPLRGALELILKTISRTYSKHTAGRTKRASGLKRDGPVMETPDTRSTYTPPLPLLASPETRTGPVKTGGRVFVLEHKHSPLTTCLINSVERRTSSGACSSAPQFLY